MNKDAKIELQHIQLELRNGRHQHMRHFIDQYYCYKKGYVTRAGRAKWDMVVWNETVSVEANKTEDRKSVVKDHVIPLNMIVGELVNLRDKSLESIQSCVDKFLYFGTITKEEDKRLNEMGMRSSMPDEYTDVDHEWYRNPLARYLKAGIDLV